MIKTCRLCKKSKEISEFHKAQTNADGYCNTCKPCKYKADAFARDKRRNTPEFKAHERAMHIKRKFGISLEEYWALEKAQHKCAICNKSFDGTFDKQLDHCHATGKIRQFLCQKCNKALGLFNDNPAVLRQAANYLEK